MAKDMGCDINTPISFHEFLTDAYFATGVHTFLIDDADILLQYLTNVPIEAATFTSGEYTKRLHGTELLHQKLCTDTRTETME